MRITLEITAGPEAGRKVWLSENQSLVIGRTQLAELSLPGDSQLSSLHFEIRWDDGLFRLRDLKSTNGTKLNGVRVQDAILHDGDLITAGRTKFLVGVDQHAPSSASQPKIPSHTVTQDAAPDPVTASAPGSKTEPKINESIVLPAVSGASGTIVFDTPVQIPTPAARPTALSDEQSDEDIAPVLEVDNRTQFSVACLPWQNAEGIGRLTVIIKATFSFTPSEAQIADQQLPIEFADQHEGDDPQQPVRFEADTAPFKPRADIVLVGSAYAPGGRPRTSVDVRLRVGALNRRLRVFGDRRWLFPTRLAVVPQVTDPVPFAEMPLTYRRAFGGMDEPAARYCAENLAGVGFIGEPAPASIHDKPLPNIEDPERLIRAWDARPQPAGFGFYGRNWQPRLRFAGTYDERYLRERAPRPPADFSYEFYNGAHPDLQVAGYLDGDELVELENVTRDGFAKFTLPGIRPRITITRYVGSSWPRERKTERRVKPVLDALVLVPDQRIFYELFRAVFSVGDIDNPDIAQIRIE